jgi:histidine triad (HIT) family protein
MLSEEEADAVKKQLIEHIDRTFPEDKKDYARQHVYSMDAEHLEEFLTKNNLISGHDSRCIFCSIVSGDIPSYMISDAPEALAVLEINPASRGHVLIIPKKHAGEEAEMPEDAEKLAAKLSKKIKAKLRPKRVDVLPSSAFGHNVINLLPVYVNETLSSKRQAANKAELEQILGLLKEKQKAATGKSSSKPKKSVIKRAEEAIEKIGEKLWLPQRIP